MFRKVKKNQTRLRKRDNELENSPESSVSSKASGAEEDDNILTTAQKRRQLRQKNMIQTVKKLIN